MDINKLINSLADMASFVTVVEEGDFSAASRKLGVTPSAVSRQVTRLEQTLGVKLLERTTRKMDLSSSGRPVFELCRAMLDSAQEVVNVVATVAEPEGLLRIAAPKALAKQILEPLLLAFALRYPKIKLQIKVTDHIVDPIHNEVDIVVTLEREPILGLIAKELGEVKIILCACPDYLRQLAPVMDPKDLQRHSCITLGESANNGVLELQKEGIIRKIQVSGRISVNHSEIRLQAVLKGLGIGLLPDFVAAEQLQKGNLIKVLADWEIKHNYQGKVRLQYAQSKFMPERVKLLVAYLVDNYPGEALHSSTI